MKELCSAMRNVSANLNRRMTTVHTAGSISGKCWQSTDAACCICIWMTRRKRYCVNWKRPGRAREVIRETRLGVNVFLAHLAERNGDRKKAEEHVRTAIMALEDMTQVSSEYDSIQNLLQYVEKIGKPEQIEEVLNCLEPKAAIEQNKSLLLQLLSLRMRYCSSRMTPEEFKQSADTFFHLKDSWELTENSQVMYMMELRKRLQAAEEEQKEQERKRNRLLYQADHDELTGLYNKRSLNRYLEDVFEDCLLNEKELGILFLDIDHFKQLNDRYGHGRGDEGICAVADTLKNVFRRTMWRVTAEMNSWWS